MPGSIVALLAGTVLVMGFHGDTAWGVATIGTKFNGIPQGLPALTLPEVHWLELPNLVRPALTIALLAAIESLLCAVVADGMTGRRHRSNCELVAQGVANIGSALFGGNIRSRGPRYCPSIEDKIVRFADSASAADAIARGLTLDGGASWLLPRRVGLHRAKELALFADIDNHPVANDDRRRLQHLPRRDHYSGFHQRMCGGIVLPQPINWAS